LINQGHCLHFEFVAQRGPLIGSGSKAVCGLPDDRCSPAVPPLVQALRNLVDPSHQQL